MKIKVEEAIDSKSFSITVLQPGDTLMYVLQVTYDDPTQPVVFTKELAAGFGTSWSRYDFSIDDFDVFDKKFPDGVYYFRILNAADTSVTICSYATGFLGIITNILRKDGLSLDFRSKSFEDVENHHFKLMIQQNAIWAAETAQTTVFQENLTLLKKILPYFEEIEERYNP